MPRRVALQTLLASDAGPVGDVNPQQLWRVLGADGSARQIAAPADAAPCLDIHPPPGASASPRVDMPGANTDLSKLLGEDDTLCVNRAVSGRSDCQPSEPPTPKSDSRLARVVEAWPRLPRPGRSAILAMIEAASREE
jgi:hypothetical protein